MKTMASTRSRAGAARASGAKPISSSGHRRETAWRTAMTGPAQLDGASQRLYTTTSPFDGARRFGSIRSGYGEKGGDDA